MFGAIRKTDELTRKPVFLTHQEAEDLRKGYTRNLKMKERSSSLFTLAGIYTTVCAVGELARLYFIPNSAPLIDDGAFALELILGSACWLGVKEFFSRRTSTAEQALNKDNTMRARWRLQRAKITMRIANNIIINKVALEARTSAQQGEYIIPMLRKLPDNDTKSYAIACEAEEAFPTPRISKTTCTRAEWKEIWRNQRNKLTLAQAMQERPRLRNGRYNPVQITISGASSVDFTLESGHKIDLSAPAHV